MKWWVWALVVVVLAQPAAAEPPRLRIVPAWGALQDCSTGSSLGAGARFALIDDRGWQGEVVVAQPVECYDGCGGRCWDLLPEARNPDHRVGRLGGPLPPGQRLRRARVLGVPFRPPRSAQDRLVRLLRTDPPTPGFIAEVRVDLDGDGSIDAELGDLVCDSRSGPDDEVRREWFIATRLRTGRTWHYSDVGSRASGLEWRDWAATMPYSFCPFEPPAPETEIAPEARYQARPVPMGEGVRR
jgi:hypothetical protein